MRPIQPKAWFVHGFNVRDYGRGTVDKLHPHFRAEGFDPEEFDYGWIGLLGVRFWNGMLARQLTTLAEHESSIFDPLPIGIGHSNGCALLHLASHMGAPFRRLIYINPALDKDATPGKNVDRVDIWHSPSDVPVQLAKWIPGHAWGEMGATGYVGDDPRMRNHNKQSGFRLSSRSHSDVFSEPLLGYFGPKIATEGT